MALYSVSYTRVTKVVLTAHFQRSSTVQYLTMNSMSFCVSTAFSVQFLAAYSGRLKTQNVVVSASNSCDDAELTAALQSLETLSSFKS